MPAANVRSVAKVKSSKATPPTVAPAGAKAAIGASHFRGHRPFYARPDKRGSVLLRASFSRDSISSRASSPTAQPEPLVASEKGSATR